MLSEKDVSHLAELVRIALTPDEKRSLLRDLEEILAYFEELKTLDTENVPPMTGGTFSENVTREDEAGGALAGMKAVEAFPESQGGFLKVPPVFGE